MAERDNPDPMLLACALVVSILAMGIAIASIYLVTDLEERIESQYGELSD